MKHFEKVRIAPMELTRRFELASWACAAFTLLSALVSAGFSLLALRMAGGG